MGFGNNAGLWALLGLVPFILIYLRKPRPKEKVIPSLMFLMADRKKSKHAAFLNRLLANLLFFLQLAAIAGLAVAVAKPFLMLSYDVKAEHTVFVIDASASMQTKYGSSTRFEEAIEAAKKELTRKNSIVVAENLPLVIAEKENEEDSAAILSELRAKATSTNIGGAMLAAKNLLKGGGRVIVLSDFLSNDGPDIMAVKTLLESEDIPVSFVDLSGEASNVGFVEMNIDQQSTKVFVKNFNDKEANVKISLKSDNKLISAKELRILPRSRESILFDTPMGTAELEIDAGDDLMIDNKAFISNPLSEKIEVVLITNKDNSHLEYALQSLPNIRLYVVTPPVLTITRDGEKISPYEKDVIIVSGINLHGADSILPGTFNDLKRYVNKGGNLVIAAQDDLAQLDTAGLLPVRINNVVTGTFFVRRDVVNEFTKNLNERGFASATRYLDAVPSGTVIASTNGKPVFVYDNYGKGKVFYYGILDDYSDFSMEISYPIFWNDLVSFLVELEDIDDYNVKTGRMISSEENGIRTPSEEVEATRVLADEAGYYIYDGKTVAVNLLDEKESDVGIVNNTGNAAGSKPGFVAEDRELDVSSLVLLAVFLLLSYELWYIKRRGDF